MSEDSELPRLNSGFSALQRAEIAEMRQNGRGRNRAVPVSVLFNEPKLLKFLRRSASNTGIAQVSVLFNEPKLLKSNNAACCRRRSPGFSALQRAEIAEIRGGEVLPARSLRVSVLFNEPKLLK